MKNITKGNWEAVEIQNQNGSYWKVYGGETSICNITTRNMASAEANAQLIADAGATTNQCGLLPSVLLEEHDRYKELFYDYSSELDETKLDNKKLLQQMDELKEMLKICKEYLPYSGLLRTKATELINTLNK